MTTRLTTELASHLTRPLRFQPILKRIRWGGRRLGTVLQKPIGDGHDYAESWEICDHDPDQSIVATGPLAGWTLPQLIRAAPREMLGIHADRTQFPLLVKFLDAQDRLSVQVHPDDDRAAAYRPGENGKTEAWVVLDAGPSSVVFMGLRAGINRIELEQALDQGKVAECLHRVAVRPGDCLFIPAGTVHAVGDGVLLAEVQQSSDLTFRLYDWGRVGADGQPRPLHREAALAAIDFSRGPVDPVTPEPLAGPAEQSECLVRCPYFELRRHRSTLPFSIPAQQTSQVLMVIAGQGGLVCAEFREPFRTGETCLLPAAAPPALIEPEGELVVLEMFVP